MIKLENTKTYGWEAAIRGMRNPMNSWEKSDTLFFDFGNSEGLNNVNYFHTLTGKREILLDEEDCVVEGCCDNVGQNDHKLMMNLAKAGSVDAKYRRMIIVTVDIAAPLYWWKEFDTYKVGTVANSCSTMHKIHSKEFTLEDFSCEHLFDWPQDFPDDAKVEYFIENGAYEAFDTDYYLDRIEDTIAKFAIDALSEVIKALNHYRIKFLETKDKRYWWQMIQLLPSSYNQRRTIMLNYEVLAGIYPKRKDHRLDEWYDFCEWIRELPYSEIITLEEETI